MSPNDPSAPLGVRRTDAGGELRVWSANAESLELVLFDATDRDWVTARVPMTRGDDNVWSATSPDLTVGTSYSVRASGPRGPRHQFDAGRDLIDPYARGLARSTQGEWRSIVADEDFESILNRVLRS